ncbi:acetolactate synthase [Bacillus canaveralius]|uniref:Acetolactate synthase n=1 Tax=Bacillus canaveralius TaxID=1403243 RepID=A0A2N5GMP3_9BACI|nr:thiamine pyrophosphate-binding protein [Bacillus canaveralius]PLR83274.1 acetolactate synthase [Bacillus canaveralius]PLR96679.1 acetolactate synthase [Bacillus canaveralius]RSK55233.1 thiamine pyrophosphate-binding protein [Bacillus canaveralius]
MNGAQAVIETLKREGVKYVFGLPGTTIMHLIDALYDEKEIRYITVRHEQVAAFMADGYARATGEIGVCMASRGPGAANLTIGIHNAYAESVPVLALLGQVSDQIYYQDAFEEMDLVKFFEPITKWALEIHQTERIPELLQRGITTALSGRPRPVAVSLPLDAQIKEGEFSFRTVFRSKHRVVDLQGVKQAAELLKNAKNPVIIAGGGVVLSGGTRDLVQLAEQLAIPVITTWRKPNVFPNDHHLYFGNVGPGCPSVCWKLIDEADVVLAVGMHFSEFSTNRWTALNEQTRLIHIDIDEAELGKIYIPEVALLGDARETVQEIIKELAGYDEIAEHRESFQKNLPQYKEETKLPEQVRDRPVLSTAVMGSINRMLENYDAIVVEDAATFGPWLTRYGRFKPGNFYAAAGGSMGWGFPASMGIKLANPDKVVTNVTGDGAFWMVAQDLETAVRENIPVINIVLNNFCYGNTRDRQKTAHQGRYIGIRYNNIDFAQFARLLGAYGERVESADDLDGAIERAIASGKPAIIDIIQDQWEGLPPGAIPAISK